MRKIELLVKWFLRIIIVASLIYTMFIKHWVGTAGGSIVLVLTFIVDYINHKFLKIDYTITATVYFYCIFSLVMGNMWNFYDKIEWWDLLMHILSGIILGIIGNVILSKNLRKIEVKKVLRFFFIVGMACIGGVVWEIYEFAIDSLFNLNTQIAKESGITDTMWDLIMDLIGGIVIAMYFLLYNKKCNNFKRYNSKIKK